MKILDKIIHSNIAPNLTNVLWADSVTNKLKIFKNGKWEVISTEDDPNIAAWAKASTKPTYIVEEITNAASITLVSGKANKVPVIEHGTSNTTFNLIPNEFHVWGTVTSLTLTLTNPVDPDCYAEYIFEFTSGSTPTSLSISPNTIKWPETPDIEANKTYQVSILNGIGLIVAVDNT